MPKFIDAIASNPGIRFFRVVDSDTDHPGDWELEPLQTDLLSDADSDGLHVMKALNVLPDGMIRECYMDMNLPERISDYAFFVETRSLRYGYHHEFPGQIMPALALDCFGVYEMFYSRTRPEIGIDILRRGLSIATRKRWIAQDLAYIFRDERRFADAAEMFKIVVEEEPCSAEELSQSYLYFIYGELASAYAEIGDAENEKKYLAIFKQAQAHGIAQAQAVDRRERIRTGRRVLVASVVICVACAAILPMLWIAFRDWPAFPGPVRLLLIASLLTLIGWQIGRLSHRRWNRIMRKR